MSRSAPPALALLWIAAVVCGAPSAALARRRPQRRPPPVVAAQVGPSPGGTPPAPASATAPRAAGADLVPDAARVFERSYSHEAAGRFDEALRDLADLAAPERETYLARLRRGWLLYLVGRHADSLAAYRQTIAAAPDSVEARVGLLLPLIALRQWADAERGARAALELDPANYLAGLRLAFAVYNQGRYKEAEGLYRRVLARYPSDAVARSGLGWSLIKQGRRSEAWRELRDASLASPRLPAVVDGLEAAKG
jgi:tetratricopeptide (TPR) repeat protein